MHYMTPTSDFEKKHSKQLAELTSPIPGHVMASEMAK